MARSHQTHAKQGFKVVYIDWKATFENVSQIFSLNVSMIVWLVLVDWPECALIALTNVTIGERKEWPYTIHTPVLPANVRAIKHWLNICENVPRILWVNGVCAVFSFRCIKLCAWTLRTIAAIVCAVQTLKMTMIFHTCFFSSCPEWKKIIANLSDAVPKCTECTRISHVNSLHDFCAGLHAIKYYLYYIFLFHSFRKNGKY